MHTPKPHHEFFKVSRLVPEDQNLATVDTQTKVRDALTLMAGSGFDQVPVTHGSRVVGVFSHRSLCAGLNAVRRTDDPQDHLVVDFLEDLSFVRTGTDFGDVLRAMEKTDVALLGDEENLSLSSPAATLRGFSGTPHDRSSSCRTSSWPLEP
ncbi:CBS domain-containing protein [Actinoplanes friuliensis]|uniref:CBS domain-containing protein n=1 Tax=Actinoplanes friuliensis DSM 7358 TaxID=1246995 RepID=U5W8F1_9ACTN|nr:CBS domain-containing protein [Actinoplanes friuliensis]AGZ44201.1 hypothetical protein AFR_29700 [Actinoplanes friuliensis DSM 7358]